MEICPIRFNLQQPAITLLPLNEKNALTGRRSGYPTNVAGKRNQLLRVRAILIGNEQVRASVGSLCVCLGTVFSEDDAPIREDIRVGNVKVAEAARPSCREWNQP